MIKRTLLKLVQDVLVSMDGDKVTTITETVESDSVADIIEQCYYNIISQFELPEVRDVVSVDEDPAAPVLMAPTASTLAIEWLKYNVGTPTQPNYVDIPYVSNEEFFTRQLSLGPVNGVDFASFNYSATASSSVPIIYGRMARPSYYTVLADKKIVFDSYDSVAGARITEANTFAFGQVETTWSKTDSFVPPLDAKLHQLLLDMARDQAHVDLKQVTNENAKMSAKRGKITARRDQYDLGSESYYHNIRQLPNYGRR